VFEQLTAFENLQLALTHRQGRAVVLERFRLDSRAARPPGRGAAHHPSGADSVARLAGTLSHGQKQWLEIGMLLMQDPKLLLLDEPVAGVTRRRKPSAPPSCFSSAQGQALACWWWSTTWVSSTPSRTSVTVLCDGAVLAQGTLGPGPGRRARDRGLILGAERDHAQAQQQYDQVLTAARTSCAMSACSADAAARSPWCWAATASVKPRLLKSADGAGADHSRHHRRSTAGLIQRSTPYERARAASATSRRAARSLRA